MADLGMLSAGEGETVRFGESTITRKVAASQTGGTWALIESREPPGAAAGLHRHQDELEVFYIVDGSYEFVSTADQRLTVGAGDVVLVPAQVGHSFSSGPSGGRTLCVLPGRFEGYFAAAADAAADPDAMAEINRRHGVERNNLGPDPDDASIRILSRDAGDALWFQDWLVVVRLDAAATDGRLSLFDCQAPRGSATPSHRDTKSQTFMMLDGEMRFWTDKRSFVAGSGATVYAPPNTAFAFRVESDHAHLLVLAAPAGLERFFRQAGQPAPTRTLPGSAATTPDRAALAHAAAQGGVTVVGPPPDLQSA